MITNSSNVEPWGAPLRVEPLQMVESGDKAAGVFSIHFGDASPPSALVVLVARAQGIHVCELYQQTSGGKPALELALDSFGKAADTIKRSAGG